MLLLSKNKKGIFMSKNVAFFKVIIGLKGELNLSNQDLCSILHIDESQYTEWIRELSITNFDNPEIKKRVVYLCGVYNKLSSFFGSMQNASEWLKTPHIGFGDISPLDYMIKNYDGVGMLNSHLEGMMNH